MASDRKCATLLAATEAAAAPSMLVADVVPLGASLFGPCLVYLATRCRRLSRRLEALAGVMLRGGNCQLAGGKLAVRKRLFERCVVYACLGLVGGVV